jgi:hypothetical protein
VTIPYIKDTSERLRRVFKSHRIGTSFRPINKISQLTIHPKDKIPKEDKCGLVYEVTCKNCDKSCIGETSRKLCTRITEHKKDYETSSTAGVSTWASHKQATSEMHKSVVTDHMIKEKHVPDWNNPKVLSKDTNNTARKMTHSRDTSALRLH